MNYALPSAIYSAILTTEAVYIQKASLSPRKGNIYFYVLKEFQFPENATVTLNIWLSNPDGGHDPRSGGTYPSWMNHVCHLALMQDNI